MVKLSKIIDIKEAFNKKQKPILFIISTLLVIAITYIRILIDQDLSLHLLYFFPIIFISWSRNRLYGYALASITLFLWFFSDVKIVFSNESLQYIIITQFIRIISFYSIISIIKFINSLIIKLYNDSRQDYLTSLLNIRSFYEFAEKELYRFRRTKQSFSLCYIDLDNFKTVNDTFGHLIGDKLLIEVGSVMMSNCRITDYIARLGGDEFVILFPDTNKSSMKNILDKVLKKLNDSMAANNWDVTFSVGAITIYDDPGSINELIKITDSLMYKIKKSGKNNVLYE